MLTIGVDLGGTNLAAGIVDNGKILHKMSVATNFKEGAGALIADIARLCNELTADFENIVSIGIGCPGIVNPKEGILVKAPNLGLFNIEISQPLSRLLNLPVFIENDANCAALGEHSRGAAKGAVSSITVTLGTGVGGGIIIDGKIYSGPFFGAGEIGHHVIVVGGEACNCGRRGCWEAYASANALKKQGFSPRTIFKDAKTNEAAKIAAENYLEYLCEGLGNIVNIFQPEIVVIGGGISGEGDALLREINARMPDKIFTEKSFTKFAIAKLGNDAGIIGAAMLGEVG